MTSIYDDEVFSTNHFTYKLCGFDLLFKKKKEELEKKYEAKGSLRIAFDYLITDSGNVLREVSDEEFKVNYYKYKYKNMAISKS